MIGVFFANPDRGRGGKPPPLAGGRGGGDIPAEPPLTRYTLAGGDYAVLRHKGPYADMGVAYRWLYGTWLPASGRSIRDAVMFEAYLNNPREVAPNELLTEICLPLQPAVAA